MAFIAPTLLPTFTALAPRPRPLHCKPPQDPGAHVQCLRRARPVATLEPKVVAEEKALPLLKRYFETFSWRGHSINYRADGPPSGHPVLIIHGFGASINHWRKNIPPLVATGHLRTYAIDLLGFGGSAKPSPRDVEYGIALWTQLVVDFMNAQGPAEKWSLVGNSIGSLVSLAAAAEVGEERVRACALMNCAGGLVSFRYSELNGVQAGLLRAFNFVLFNSVTGPYLFDNFRKRTTVANVLKQVYMDPAAISEELVDILCDPSMDEGACDVFLAILNADAGPAPEELLERLTWCPMLVLWGEADPWTPLKEGLHAGIRFPEYHPGMQFHVIPKAGHCIHDECPDVVNGYLVPFLVSPSLKVEDGERGRASL